MPSRLLPRLVITTIAIVTVIVISLSIIKIVLAIIVVILVFLVLVLFLLRSILAIALSSHNAKNRSRVSKDDGEYTRKQFLRSILSKATYSLLG